MSGFKIFGWSTLFVVTLVVLLFGGLFFATVSGESLNPLSHPNKVQALSSMLAVTLGTAAAIGGAVATIQVANLGLHISQQQETRDSIQFIENRTTKAVENYSELLVSLSELYAAGTMLDASIPFIDRDKLSQNLQDEMEKQAQEATLAEMQAFTDSIDRIRSAIRSITLDKFSHLCLVERAGTLNSKIAKLNQELGKLGVEESALSMSIENLIGVSVILEVGRRKVGAGQMGVLLSSRVLTNSADIDLFDKTYNNRAVRTLFFIGNSLFAMSDKSSSHIFIASFGTAIIHDLYRIIPSGEEIKECALKRYQTIAPSGAQILSSFKPSEIVDNSFKFALDSADEIGGLYLLSADIKKP